MDFGDIDLSFLKYENLQDEYRIELSNGNTYVAKRSGQDALAPLFEVFLPSGERYSSHVLPSGIGDVELYFLGFFTWLDAKTYRAPVREGNKPGEQPVFQLPEAVTPNVSMLANLQGYEVAVLPQALAYGELEDEYNIDLGERGIYTARRVGRGNIAPQFELFLPSGARYSLHTLPSGLEDVEIYFLGFFTWLDARSYSKA